MKVIILNIDQNWNGKIHVNIVCSNFKSVCFVFQMARNTFNIAGKLLLNYRDVDTPILGLYKACTYVKEKEKSCISHAMLHKFLQYHTDLLEKSLKYVGTL